MTESGVHQASANRMMEALSALCGFLARGNGDYVPVDFILQALFHALNCKTENRVIESALRCLLVHMEQTQVDYPTALVLDHLQEVVVKVSGDNVPAECRLLWMQCTSDTLLNLRNRLDFPRRRLHVGFAISIMLDWALKCLGRERQFKLSTKSLQTINICVEVIRDPKELVNFLPGIVSTIARILIGATVTIPHSLICEALNCVKTVITAVLEDSKNLDFIRDDEDSLRQLGLLPSCDVLSNYLAPAADNDYHSALPCIKRTQGWLESIQKYMSNFFSLLQPLSFHGHRDVRESVVDLATTVMLKCRVTMDSSLSHIVEIIILGANDSDERISASSRSALEQIQFISELQECIGQLLELHVFKLVKDVALSADDSKKLRCLQLINGCIAGIGTLSLPILTRHCQEITEALMYLLEPRLDASILIQRPEYDSAQLVDCAPTLVAHKFTHFDDNGIHMEICNLIKHLVFVKPAVELILQKIPNPSAIIAYRHALKILSNTNAAKSIQFWRSHASILVNSGVLECALSPLAQVDTLKRNVAASAAAFECLQDMIKLIGSDHASKLQHIILYPILQSVGSPFLLVSESAQAALLSLSTDGDLNAMILSHSDLLCNSLSFSLRYNDSTSVKDQLTLSMAPKVLCVCVRIAGPEILPFVDDVIEDMIELMGDAAQLARFTSHEWCLNVLQAFEALLSAINQFTRGFDFDTDPHSHKSDKKVTAISELVKAHRKSLHIKSDIVLDEELIGRCSDPVINFIIGYLNRQMSSHESIPINFVLDIENGMQVLHDSSSSGISVCQTGKSVSVKKFASLRHKLLETVIRYMSSDSPQIRLQALKAFRSSIGNRSNSVSDLLATLNQNWQTVVQRISDVEVQISTEAIAAVTEYLQATGNYLANKLRDHIIPICCSLLNGDLQLIKSRHISAVYSAEIKRINAIIGCFQAAFANQCFKPGDSQTISTVINHLCQLASTDKLVDDSIRTNSLRCINAMTQKSYATAAVFEQRLL